MGDLILSMKGITKSFSGVAALKNAALDLKAGEVVALMGENGAGKSTLMKILTGIYSKDSGEIQYMGQEPQLQVVILLLLVIILLLVILKQLL